MPELPEVETVARRIEPLVVGKQIVAARVLWNRTVGGLASQSFSRLITGKQIAQVTRRAKYILIKLAPTGHLGIHLRMSGDLVAVSGGTCEEKHLRVALHFDDGSELRFVDTRKFGRFVYYEDVEQLVQRLGPEPIDSDFDFESFYKRLQATSRQIKPVLLDQAVVGGLGNIYVVESLWRARVHPLTRANALSRKEVRNLISAAAEILHEAIAAHGTDLGDGVWKTGGFTPSTYGREGEACHRCGSLIKKIRVAQRGTEFCSRCQRQR